MRRLMMLAGLALVASLVIGGAAAASASAAEIFLTKGTYPQPILSKSNRTSTLSSTAGSVTCSSLLNKGTLWSPKDALVLLLFHGCKDNLGNNCQSAGEPTGLIHVLLLALPVWLNKAQTLPGLLFEKHQGEPDIASFKCGLAVTVLVRGSVLGHITKPAPKTPSSEMEVNVLAPGGVQEFTKVEEGTAEDKLEVSFTGGAFVPATEEAPADIIHFENAGVEAEFR